VGAGKGGVRATRGTGGGPAAQAGLKVGDVIRTAGGVALHSSDHLVSVLARYTPGDQIELKVVRGGKEMTLTATLDRLPPTGRPSYDTWGRAPCTRRRVPFPQRRPTGLFP